jgi:ABC-type polar amino acid transport system ATPase subunit
MHESLVVPDAGRIRIGGDTFTFDGSSRLPSVKEQARFRSGTGMVFQHFNLFPHMTVIQNVMGGPISAKKMPKDKTAARAAEGMTMVIVTHEIAFAREVAERVIFMRDGVIVEEEPAREVIDHPGQEATRVFLSLFHMRS